MSDKIMRAFEDNRSNPFHFKHMKLCHNLAELAKVPEPKVGGVKLCDYKNCFTEKLSSYSFFPDVCFPCSKWYNGKSEFKLFHVNRNHNVVLLPFSSISNCLLKAKKKICVFPVSQLSLFLTLPKLICASN